MPANFSDALVAGGLVHPTLMAIAPDRRLFVSEQRGTIRVIKKDVLLPTPFVTLNANTDGERGAFGIAFDPGFGTNRFVYFYYTSSVGPPHNRVSRFTANGDVAAGTETVLLELPPLSSTIHNGGAIHFGPDGKLYIAVGQDNIGTYPQHLTNPFGKLLRINPDGTIPTDNPFYNSATGVNRAIWALGLRNPWTFAFQRGTGRLLINDVGQNTWEEINEGARGANYGWPRTEGPTADPAFESPFYAYDHATGCAITAGAFYNPWSAMLPASYVGDYLFGDYCAGWIRSIDLVTKTITTLATGVSSVTDIQVGPGGAVYYIERGTGSVRRITYSASGTAPAITRQPANQTVGVGGTATIIVEASGTAPLSYQWQRNQVDIAGANGASYSLSNVQQADSGARFRAIVSNSVGIATSAEAILNVTSNRPPVADITTPVSGTLFSGGQTFSYAGDGTDPEEGTLPATAFTWRAVLFHDDGNLHSHPFHAPASGAKTGSFTIPTTGETSPNIWYRLYLTVTDGQGATHVDSTDLLPRTVTIRLASNPSKRQLRLDGTAITTPSTFTAVVGIRRTIEAISPQLGGEWNWYFRSWSDGGAQGHVVSTPAASTTYTATFAGEAALYQAEKAVLSGAVVGTTHAGYTGPGYAHYVNPSNDYVEWTVTTLVAGTRRLEFRYALGVSATRSLQISVNGTVADAGLPFPGTGAWTTWRTVTIDVPLSVGTHRIRATAMGTSGPEVDRLVIR